MLLLKHAGMHIAVLVAEHVRVAVVVQRVKCKEQSPMPQLFPCTRMISGGSSNPTRPCA